MESPPNLHLSLKVQSIESDVLCKEQTVDLVSNLGQIWFILQ